MPTKNNRSRNAIISDMASEFDFEVTRAVAANPLGEVANAQRPHIGFNPADLLTIAADAVPAWQRDMGQKPSLVQAAVAQQQAILRALSLIDRCGVILDLNGAIVQGNAGWAQRIDTIPTLSVCANILVPISPQSQLDLLAGLESLRSDTNSGSVPIALRDLDGWVVDYVHLKSVSPQSPDRAYVVLPKSPNDVSRTLEHLGAALRLTPLEAVLVRLIVKGEKDKEIGLQLGLKLPVIKRTMRQLLAKFAVRQKNDIFRMISSFP